MAKKEKEELLEIRMEVTFQYAVTSANRSKMLPAVEEHMRAVLRGIRRGDIPERYVHHKASFWTNENDPEMGLIETIDRIRELRREADEEERNCDYDPHNYVQDRVAALRGEARDLAKKLHEKTGWIE